MTNDPVEEFLARMTEQNELGPGIYLTKNSVRKLLALVWVYREANTFAASNNFKIEKTQARAKDAEEKAKEIVK